MAAFANGSCRRPPHPSSETSRTIPSRNRERWRNSPPGGWAPGLRHPLASPRPPEGTRSRFLKQHLQVPSDIAGSGGAPRQATAWEAEARIHAGLLCRDREHGGTQAVSRRSGSPREARSEGPKVLFGSVLTEAVNGRLVDGRAPVLVFLVLGLDDLKVELLDLGREGTDLAVREGAPIHLDDGRDLGPGSAEERLVTEIEL